MKQKMKLSLAILSLIALTLTSCRPPELETAVMEFNKKRYDSAQKQALEATEKYPDNAEAWWILGVSTLEMAKTVDEFAQGNEALDKAKALNKKEYGKNVDDYKYHQFGTNFNKSVSYFNQAAGLSESDTLNAVAEKAIEKGKIAAIFKPEASNSYSIIARTYALIGDTVNTQKYYEKAYETSPDSLNIAFDLGYFYYAQKKDYASAIDVFNKLVSSPRTDNDAVAYKKDGYILLIQSLEMSGREEESMDVLIKSVDYNKDEPGIPFTLAMKYYKMQSWEDASKYFTLAIERGMEEADPYLFAGNCRNLAQKYQEAREILEMGVQKFPDNGQMWSELAKSYAQLGMKDEAKDAYDKAKKFGIE